MTGHFDNKEQFTEMKAAGKIFPYAQHVNTVCNDKINNIPEDFHGIFIVEDKNTFSYDSMKNVDYSKLKNLKSLLRHCTMKMVVSGKVAAQAVSLR